jgi:hypothetical protein
LIYQALLEEVGDAEPSSQVWENICRQVRAAARPPTQRARGMNGLYRGLGAIIDLFLYDHGWEARLAARRPLCVWPGQILLVF